MDETRQGTRRLVLGELTPAQRAADPDRWERLFRGEGRVVRDPRGRLFLEVRVGEAWWAAPIAEEATAELVADVTTAGLGDEGERDGGN